MAWTFSQRQAFSFVWRAVREGLSATEALRQYRSGGGRIRDAYWYDLYRQVQDEPEKSARLGELPEFYTPSDEFATEVYWDSRQQYLMKMKLHVIDPLTGAEFDQWYTVESDVPLTMAEWEDMAVTGFTSLYPEWSNAVAWATEFHFLKSVHEKFAT